MPRKKHIHTAKFRRCVKKVSKKSKGVNPYAVCGAAIGYKGSIARSSRKLRRVI